jgi:NitT/TauT family transport system permease protein
MGEQARREEGALTLSLSKGEGDIVVRQAHHEVARPPRLVAYRGEVFRPREIRLVGLLAIAALLGVWQLAAMRGWVSPVFAPAPSEVFASLSGLATSGALVQDLAASLGRLAAGWSLGAAAGVAAGFAIGLSTLARSAGAPLVAALFPIPKIALLPLFILWFGIGEGSKVATIAFGVFFPTVVATYGGVDSVDRTLVRMGRAFGLPSRAILMKIVLPGATPAILSGVRISASIGIILLVAAEMIGASNGVGARILLAGNLMRVDELLAGVVVLSLMGLTVGALVGAVERRLLKWR